MFGEKYSIMCLYIGRNHTFQKQSQVFERLNKIYLGISYGLLTVFVITTNLMLIYGFYKTSRPFTIITKLFIYLSLVDIIVSLIVIIYITLTFLNYPLACLMVFVIIFLLQLIYFLDISIFMTISFLRYRSIRKPLHSINANRITMLMIVQFIVCGIIGSSFLCFYYFKVSSELMVKVNYAVPGTQFLAVAFVLIVNIISYRNLKSMKKMSGFTDNVENTSNQRQKMSEANTCLLYITAFYVLCPLPLITVFMIGFENVLQFSWGYYFFSSGYISALSNGGINASIVILRTKKLFEFYRNKFLSKIHESGTELETIQKR